MDCAAKKEYEAQRTALEAKRGDLLKRVQENQDWISSFEKNDSSGAFEDKYKQLLAQIEQIYATAKEFHGKGIDMLIRDFAYHLAFRRWVSGTGLLPGGVPLD
jgi:hypothetical protein